MRLPRFISKSIPGFEVTDLKEWISKGYVEIFLKRKESTRQCHRCMSQLDPALVGKHKLKIRHMDTLGMETYLVLWRQKHHCKTCKKTRSEYLHFVSKETPHVSEEYAWWLGRLCEISPVSRAAQLTNNNPMSMWRFDFKRMKRMFQNYKLPPVKRICVDEVYARKKKGYYRESRDRRFFTIICDLDSKRVLWVSESRSKEALDQFFHVLGKQKCKEIEVVAGDQFDGYRLSMEQNCPNAEFVWDRFHIMQTFNKYLNEQRASLHRNCNNSELKRLTRGKFKQLFTKRAQRRTPVEKRHIRDVMEDNVHFVYLELLKEGMHEIFESESSLQARRKFDEMGEWIKEVGKFKEMESWWKNFNDGWSTFKNYFKHRVSSSLSEGMNNVIKTIKKRAYGYRNMAYFKLKILQVCGYLNSRYISMSFQ